MKMIPNQIKGILATIRAQHETEDIIHDQQKRLDDLKKALKDNCLKRGVRIDLQRKVYVLESNIKALHRKSFFADAQKKMCTQ